MLTDVALLVLHVSVADWPGAMVSGVAVRVAVGRVTPSGGIVQIRPSMPVRVVGVHEPGGLGMTEPLL